MTNTTKNQEPVERLKDGRLTVAIWKNPTKDGDTFFSISPTQRSYKNGQGEYQNTTSLSGTQILQSARLQELAYTRVLELDAAEYAATKEANGVS